MHTFSGKEYPCCTSLAMGIIGGKWKTVIIYHLKNNTLRYNELRKRIPWVTERTLSLQLKNIGKRWNHKAESLYFKATFKSRI